MKATIYETNTGSIKRVATVPDSMIDLQIGPGESYVQLSTDMDGVDDETHYVELGTKTVQPRAEIVPTVTTATSQVTLTNLPDPCTVTWNRQEGVVTGGEAVITFDEPGTKQLVLRSDPEYLEQHLEVEIP